MNKKLISFGNYLLSRYNVMVHSTDGKNTPLYQRQVCDADLENWKDECEDSINTLPSRFQIGDIVSVSTNGFTIDRGEVVRVHFTEGKVMYDLQVEGSYDDPLIGGLWYTRIYNIDSAFLKESTKNLVVTD